MIETCLNDPGLEHDGIDVVLCSATDGEVTKKTCVRADNTIPAGSFGTTDSPLFELDIYDGHSAWVFKAAPTIGYISKEQRLMVLLGQEVTVDRWKIKAWP